MRVFIILSISATVYAQCAPSKVPQMDYSRGLVTAVKPVPEGTNFGIMSEGRTYNLSCEKFHGCEQLKIGEWAIGLFQNLLLCEDGTLKGKLEYLLHATPPRQLSAAEKVLLVGQWNPVGSFPRMFDHYVEFAREEAFKDDILFMNNSQFRIAKVTKMELVLMLGETSYHYGRVPGVK